MTLAVDKYDSSRDIFCAFDHLMFLKKGLSNILLEKDLIADVHIRANSITEY